MPEQKLLVIGAGIGQVFLIEKAKKRGVNTTVVTLPGQPGIDLADNVFFCDINERAAVTSWAREQGITAVISDQNDLMNPTVAYVAEKLGLPGNSYSQVNAYCNKNRFREICDRVGIPVPIHKEALSVDDPGLTCRFPWMVKPADSQSSVGVRRVNERKGLKPALEEAFRCSRTNSAIVEEFIEGREIVCEGFVEDGRYHLLAFGDRKYFATDGFFIPAQTIFPSVVKPKLLERVHKYEQMIASYIHPSFGIVHSEYLVNEEKDEVFIVESALRGGGVYISSHLIPMATGIDINDVLLDMALGEPVDFEKVFRQRKDAAAGYVCFHLPEGTVRDVRGTQKLRELPFVKMICLENIKPGYEAEPMVHKGLRKGPIIVAGTDREELEKHIEIVQRTLCIEVEKPDGSVGGILWE